MGKITYKDAVDYSKAVEDAIDAAKSARESLSDSDLATRELAARDAAKSALDAASVFPQTEIASDIINPVFDLSGIFESGVGR